MEIWDIYIDHEKCTLDRKENYIENDDEFFLNEAIELIELLKKNLDGELFYNTLDKLYEKLSTKPMQIKNLYNKVDFLDIIIPRIQEFVDDDFDCNKLDKLIISFIKYVIKNLDDGLMLIISRYMIHIFPMIFEVEFFHDVSDLVKISLQNNVISRINTINIVEFYYSYINQIYDLIRLNSNDIDYSKELSYILALLIRNSETKYITKNYRILAVSFHIFLKLNTSKITEYSLYGLYRIIKCFGHNDIILKFCVTPAVINYISNIEWNQNIFIRVLSLMLTISEYNPDLNYEYAAKSRVAELIFNNALQKKSSLKLVMKYAIHSAMNIDYSIYIVRTQFFSVLYQCFSSNTLDYCISRLFIILILTVVKNSLDFMKNIDFNVILTRIINSDFLSDEEITNLLNTTIPILFSSDVSQQIRWSAIFENFKAFNEQYHIEHLSEILLHIKQS